MNIINNKKAFFNYFLEDQYEAGIVLNGWEVKSLRSKNVQIKESHIIIYNNELIIIGLHISPLKYSSIYLNSLNPSRKRKLLLHKHQIKKLIGKIKQKGYTLIPLNLHYKKNLIKCEVGLMKGKKQYDKRLSEKQREWNLEKSRLINIKTNFLK